MTDKTDDSPADMLFAEGMKYDWRQTQSLGAATLARAAFQQAATMGNTKAIRALAHMIFEGSGGGRDREQALLLLWSSFLKGDHNALEELVDLLESYTESIENPSNRKETLATAQCIEELDMRLQQVGVFMRELASKRLNLTPS
jgi:TPR repeat protein